MPNDTFCVLALTELAHLHIELDELADAERVLAEAQTRSMSHLGDGAIVSRRGFLHLATGDLDAAATYAARAQVFFHGVGYRRFEAGSRCYAGIIELARGDAVSARRAFESAYETLRHDRRGEYLSRPGSPTRCWSPAIATARSTSSMRCTSSRPTTRSRSPPRSCACRSAPATSAARAASSPRRAIGGPGGRRRRARSTSGSRSPRSIAPAAPIGSARHPPPAPAGLRIDADGAAFEIAGERGSLARHRTLRRILLALVEQRLSAPGVALTWEAVFAVGWPNDRAQPEAARNRVKVAISTLRTLGLRDLVFHDGTGYLIDPATPVHVDGAAAR